MTPPQPVAEIAKQAAEAIKEIANDVLRRHADADPRNQSILIGDAILPELTALILSAAAKMVQQSGAVEALEEAQELVPTQLYLSPSGELYAAKDACAAALHSLRSITGEAGDSQG